MRRKSSRISNKENRSSRLSLKQQNWQIPYNFDNFVEPLKEEAVVAINNTAMKILEEIGVLFLNPEACKILQKAGCKVDFSDSNVKMDRRWVMDMLKTVPQHFSITPRNHKNKIKIGDRYIVFGNVSSPPNVLDLDRGKRPGDFDSFKDLTKLTQFFNCIHFSGGYPVEPVDIHPSIRHLHCLYEQLTLTDKVVHAYSLGPERVEDAIEMAKIASGLDEKEFFSKPRIFTNINSTSPLKHDWPMLDGAMRFAKKNQPVVVTPFTLAGAMSPVTITGSVAQALAEALSAIALFQYISPGSPCVLGTFTSNVDMKSGAPAFGTPEYIRATQITGQMARFYKIPLRASNACASNAPDAQATWESSNSLWSAISGGINMVYHGAGWLEGGLIASYEKFIIDCEIIQQLQKYLDPEITNASEEKLAFSAIKEVGHNGHFFGATHTQERYKDAFYAPILSDWRNYEAWEADGKISTEKRANNIWKQILEEFEPPMISSKISSELDDFVQRRIKEGGAKTDF